MLIKDLFYDIFDQIDSIRSTAKKGFSLHLRARNRFQRDLVYLTLNAYRDPNFTATLPTASSAALPSAALDEAADAHP